ncbi:phage Gp37/Gp68 family protein [Akkermansiaceae bacterium]|nr:phage Gp37/Gp68 family protein [Akkermansiaceae bacterium]MDB4537063.1 phage Gp37/Gp68 family protein [Akkermansiaceae bacterium]
MSEETPIQWTNTTVNPVMGCDGCELWPTLPKIISGLITRAKEILPSDIKNVASQIRQIMSRYEHVTAVWHDRYSLVKKLAKTYPNIRRYIWLKEIEKLYNCYTGKQHLDRGARPEDWNDPINSGYAPIFDRPTKFPDRMAKIATLPDLRNTEDPAKTWLSGLPRLIFVSDMGDALSESIEFEYLKEEIIDIVSSSNGRRHIWLWLTKRPSRMVEFAKWLKETHGLSWPDNLVSMTSVTGLATRNRIGDLRKVPAKIRGLSVEPLIEPVKLDLDGIDWVIVGGESGSHARPFDLNWARDIQAQCKEAGVTFFMKQLGANITDDGFPLKVRDPHGGDWEEWPTDLREREFPEAFRDDSLSSPSPIRVSNPNNRNF